MISFTFATAFGVRTTGAVFGAGVVSIFGVVVVAMHFSSVKLQYISRFGTN